MRAALLALLAGVLAWPAVLPVRRVVVYKNGVAFYERSGEVKAGEPAALDFRAAEVDDVLKSLLIEAPGGVQRVRYEFVDPSRPEGAAGAVRLEPNQPLAVLLDQWRGARLAMSYRGSPVVGQIVSGRLAPLPNQGQKQELTLLLDSGTLAVFDLDAASDIRLEDARLQRQLAEALSRLARRLMPDRRTLHIDLAGSGGRLTVRYLAPAPVWKSTYRLLLPDSGEASLEAWAIVENSTGEDWDQVSVSVVSGRPVSFITKLLEARYLKRREVDLPGIEPAAPQLHADAAVTREKAQAAGGTPVRTAAPIRGRVDIAEMAAAAAPAPVEMSTVAPAAEGREAGELFEYVFQEPVRARAGESLLLPIFRGRIAARRLLVYSDRSQAHPRYAAELTNTTGKTLDGGTITIYHPSGYSGEALMEELKNGARRLISYAVDQSVRVTTKFDSTEQAVRGFRAQRGLLFTRTAMQRTTVYTAMNAESKEKLMLVDHPVSQEWKLVSPKVEETTPDGWRFELKLPAQGTAKLAVVEEREMEVSMSVSSLTPDVLVTYIQNRALSADGRRQLEAVAAKKREISAAEAELRQVEEEIREISSEQDRLRQNINTLRNVAGQQEQVNRYAAELARGDARMAELRDRQGVLRKRRQTLETELNALVEKLEF